MSFVKADLRGDGSNSDQNAPIWLKLTRGEDGTFYFPLGRYDKTSASCQYLPELNLDEVEDYIYVEGQGSGGTRRRSNRKKLKKTQKTQRKYKK